MDTHHFALVNREAPVALHKERAEPDVSWMSAFLLKKKSGREREKKKEERDGWHKTATIQNRAKDKNLEQGRVPSPPQGRNKARDKKTNQSGEVPHLILKPIFPCMAAPCCCALENISLRPPLHETSLIGEE